MGINHEHITEYLWMMEEMMTNNDLEKTILSLAMFFNENSEKQNQEFLNKLYEIFDKSENLYDSEVSLAFLNFQKFATMPWLEKHPQVTDGWEKSYIECIYNGLLPHFVRQVIEKNEGTPCSGDKEDFIIQKIKFNNMPNNNRLITLNFICGAGWELDPNKLYGLNPNVFCVKITPLNITTATKEHGLEDAIQWNWENMNKIKEKVESCGLKVIVDVAAKAELPLCCGNLVQDYKKNK